MKATLIITSLVAAVFGQSITASYDPLYDNASQSLGTVACSDGPNGLLTRGFTTFGSLPRFPHIGGAPAVTGWDSPACGTCWELTWTNPAGGAKKTINIIAIDVGSRGFNLAKGALDELTNGQAAQLGRVPVASRQVAPSACGL